MVPPESQSSLSATGPEHNAAPKGPWTDTPDTMTVVNLTSTEVGLSQVLDAMVEIQTALTFTTIVTVTLEVGTVRC